MPHGFTATLRQKDVVKFQMIEFHLTGQALWDRMNRAVEKVQERLEKTARTLEAAEIPLGARQKEIYLLSLRR